MDADECHQTAKSISVRTNVTKLILEGSNILEAHACTLAQTAAVNHQLNSFSGFDTSPGSVGNYTDDPYYRI